jgi:DNA-binding GntR family transcriptional regulator
MTTARNRAYRRIRQAILDGEYGPGDHLKEEELCRVCGVSRTPVRQAIRSLVDEGLVTVAGNRRCYVADVSDAHASEMYDIISMLESYSAGLAAEKVSDEELSELHGICERLEHLVATEPENMHDYMRINAEFHKAIHRAAGNKTLYELILRVVDFPLALYLKLGRVTESESALAEHREILEALENRDSRYAALVMKKHIERVRLEAASIWRDTDD